MAGFAYEKITIGATAAGPTAATAKLGTTRAAEEALITVETQSIRLKYDGGVATTTDGHLLAAGDSIKLEDEGDVKNISMVRATGADGTVHITYGR